MHTETITIKDHYPWIPHSVKSALRHESVAVPCQLSTGERSILRRRRQMKVSDWAAQHRILTRSAIPGPWKNEFAAHMVGIMDAAALSYVRKVVVCKPPQSSGTEGIHNFAGNRIDRDPGDMLYVFPDELMAKENMRDRIVPMINASPRLRSYKTNVCDDEGNLRVNLKHMTIYIAWAGSPARLGNKPIKHLFLDEVDKYPRTAGAREAGVLAVAEKRLITYRGQSKEWVISTPTVEAGNIWVELNQCAAQFRYYVTCPDCGGQFIMDFDHIRFPENERDPVRVRELKLAWYECNHCKAKWDDARRNTAVLAGRWKHHRPGALKDEAGAGDLFDYIEKHRPQSIGFQYPAWISYFVPLSDCAASFLKAFHGGGGFDKLALRDFCNAIKAEPWVINNRDRDENRLLALRDDRPAGVVPGNGRVACLTAGIDTQDNGFWFEVRAWGFGIDLPSWQVRHGFVESFEALEQVIIRDEYSDTDGKKYMVLLALQDAMGHRTAEVYDFCRRHRRRIMPLQGVYRLQSPFVYGQLEFYPNSKKPIPGGLRLLRVNTNFFKDTIDGKLDIQPGDPGAWLYNAETTPAWLRSMTVEYIGDDGMWHCPDSKDPYAWDCSVYARVAAEVLGVKFWPATPDASARSAPEPVNNRDGPRKWLQPRGKWFRK